MNSNKSNKSRIVLPEDSYELMGLLFKVHNELGPICKEKNYQDAVELLLKNNNIPYEREKEVEIPFSGDTLKGFFVDFIINGKIILELKAKTFIKHEDIRQAMRYLKATNLPLAIIANFKRNKLEYKRVINSSNIRGIRETLAQCNILGLDYGTKKIGLAKSAGSLAVSLGVIANDNTLFQKIKEICDQEKIEKIVVGVPYPHSGVKSEQQKKSEQFVKDLKQQLKIEVVTEDERMSTLQAHKLGVGLKRGKDDDAIAAMIILQSYLDKNK